MTDTRNFGSVKGKALQLFFLFVAAIAGLIIFDALEDTLIDGSSFSTASAVIGIVFLVAGIIAYKFESAYTDLYTLA